MEKAAIGTNDLGMHIVIRPISKDLLSKDEIVGMETGKINSLLTARRPITLVDAISALPPLLPPSADPITGRRLYSIEEIMSGSCGIHFGPSVPELLRYETELSVNTVFESSIASARSAAKQIPCNGQWLTDVLGNADPDSTMVAVETLADWSMARSVIFLVAKLLSFLAAGSDSPMEDTGFARCYVECLNKTLWCIPFAFNPFFSSGKRGCRLLADKLTDYRSYQQLVGILTHREKIGDFGTEDIYAEVFGSTSYDESESAFILTSSVSSEKYRGLFDGWNDKAERNYLLCTQVGCSQRSDAENIINALIGSVSNLAVSYGQISLGWETDTSARFSDRPVPSVKRNSLFAELLYRIVYRDSLNIGICRNCGAPFLKSGIGSLNDVCSQACRMAQRRSFARKFLGIFRTA